MHVAFILLIFSLYHCEEDQFDVRHRLSTKSGYIHFNVNHSQPPENCFVLNFQHVSRHGGRYPTAKIVNSFFALQEKVQSIKHNLNQTTAKWLLNWTVPYHAENSGDLLWNGIREQTELGHRLKERYKEFNGFYGTKRFIFQSTEIPRCGESANVFANALLNRTNFSFGAIPYWWTFSYRQSDDVTLRFFENCPAYEEAAKLSRVTDNYDKFIKLHMNGIIERVQQKIDPTSLIWKIDQKIVDLFFSGCYTDIALYDATDRFCSFFEQKDIELLDYAEDLQQYYKKSNAFEINYKISCLLITEIIDNFEGKIHHSQDKMMKYQVAKFRFAHAETVIPLIAALGLYKTEPSKMRWDMTIDEIRNRSWRGSVVGPFSSNLVFILYNCGNSYLVKLLHNEKEIIIPGCEGIYCQYETFRQILKPYYNCSFNDLCALHVNTEMCSDNIQSMTAQQLFDCHFVTIICSTVFGLLGFIGFGFLLGYVTLSFTTFKTQTNGIAKETDLLNVS